jgi:hypothetical protein
MAAKKRHKSDTATFAELAKADRARSISGTISHLERAIRAHARHAADPQRALERLAHQVERLAQRLRR